MNVKIINGQKLLANMRIALLLGLFTLFFSDLFAQNGSTGDTIKVKPIEEYVNEPEILVAVEDMPEFPGGNDSMKKFIKANLVYPDSAIKNKIEGKVIIEFLVDETGKVSSPRVLKGIGSGCDEEALRIVNKMPNWKPGKLRNKPVKVRYVIPVIFSLN